MGHVSRTHWIGASCLHPLVLLSLKLFITADRQALMDAIDQHHLGQGEVGLLHQQPGVAPIQDAAGDADLDPIGSAEVVVRQADWMVAVVAADSAGPGSAFWSSSKLAASPPRSNTWRSQPPKSTSRLPEELLGSRRMPCPSKAYNHG